MADVDYVILGGGSAGCVLANRLSEDPEARVLLLEAGGAGRSPFIQMPAANGFLFGRPAFDWGFSSEPQAELNGRRLYYPRGRGLGGSSAINGMIYIRGNPLDYDGWRQLGLEGWSHGDLLPYFKRSEGNQARRDPYHGAKGPLRLGPPRRAGRIERHFLDAAGQAGFDRNDDFNGRRQLGAGLFDVTVADGRRSSAAHAYLDPIRARPNLSVLTEARAERLLFEGNRVTGVAYRRQGEAHRVRAAREVIVALGAFGSPQLLMISGLGPAAALARHDIPVVADLPGVGGNLQDHLNVSVQYGCKDPNLSCARYQRLDQALWLGLRYLMGRRGPGALPFWIGGAFAALERGAALPDLQLMFTPMAVVEDPADGRNQTGGGLLNVGRLFLSRGKQAHAGLQIDANLLHPESAGRVGLASADPADPPRIDPQFLTREKDRRHLIAAVRLSREIMGQAAFAPVLGAELAPGAAARSDEEILAAIRATACSGHHPVGTCKMGPDHDQAAVVDGALRVRGVERLRVVDGSVMPRIISGNTNGPIMMIAEKAADLIRGRCPPPREEPREKIAP